MQQLQSSIQSSGNLFSSNWGTVALPTYSQKAFLHTHMRTHKHTHIDGRRCSLLAWRTTPVSLRLLATTFTSCVLGNNSIRPFLVSRWLVVGEVVFHVQTNCGNNLPSPLWESGSPVGGSVKNSIVGKCQRAFCSILTKWKKESLHVSTTLSVRTADRDKTKEQQWLRRMSTSS